MIESLDQQRLKLISWIEQDLNKDKQFSSYEVFAFQILAIQLFYTIETTIKMKLEKEKQ